MGVYVRVSRIVGVIIRIILKVWVYSSLMLLVCILLYYMYGGIFAFILLLVALAGIFYQTQDNYLFYPELPSHSRVFVPVPTMFGLPYENVHIRAADGTLLHMFFVHQPKERQRNSPTIVYFHGNAGNMGHRLQNAVGLYHNLHCNILLVEYRGYGLSEGKPSEQGLYLDAQASIDYLYSRNDINLSEIIVFGRSLGGAVAIDLASRAEFAEKIWCLVVENTFTSISDMVKVLISCKCLHILPLTVYKNKFISIYKVMHLRVPTLFISGLADSLVPPRMMKELHKRCGSTRKQLLQLPTGTHNETWTVPNYYHLLATFLQNCRLHIFEAKNKESGITNNEDWVNVQVI